VTAARHRTRAARGVLVAIATALLLPAAASAAPASASAGERQVEISVTVPELGTGTRVLTDAELLWGLNAESGGRAHAGGCHFLMAGRPGATGDAGGSRVWTAADGLYRASDGAVRVTVPDGSPDGRVASWDTRCQTPDGRPVGGDAVSQARVSLRGGTGVADLDAGTLQVDWTGTFSVVYYGGLTYWWASDPQLRVAADGTGTLTATLGGYAASRDDASAWEPVPPRRAVLADLRVRDGELTASGLVTTPRYVGVEANAHGQSARTPANEPYWGAFPASFLDFQTLTGQSGYWLATGGEADPRKVAAPVTVRLRAGSAVDGEQTAPAVVAPPSGAVAQPAQPAAPARTVASRAASSPLAAVPALAQGPAAFAVPATATFSGVRTDLVGRDAARARDGARATVGLAGVLLGTAGALVGFRRGWLVLPGRG
jgi:hypothetical protein